MMPFTITTVKTARMLLRGTNPTFGEIAELVENAAAIGVPDSATVEIERTMNANLPFTTVVVTWTSEVSS